MLTYDFKTHKMYGDNTAANKLTKENKIATGDQFIDAPYHWVQELVRNKKIIVLYVNTNTNVADIHTKSITRQTVEKLVNKACGHETLWQNELIQLQETETGEIYEWNQQEGKFSKRIYWSKPN